MLEGYRPRVRRAFTSIIGGLTNKVVVFSWNTFAVVDDFDGTQTILLYTNL
jgi:hypothetical protein